MNDQQLHDQKLIKMMEDHRKNGTPIVEADSKEKLEALLEKKSKNSKSKERSSGLGPIAQAMRDHPGLTSEEAIEMAEAFGF
ncbi:MAG: hypothetical protein JEY71_05090 [Sphaerochaeta sp.]|nr:hypothetical protein [Sphaerochaeta sp.]